eukprot:TRINITY_DN2682_c0_g1_i1.p1 TRINITY_DN2682_c0_g1~~TRINITY_DN2682_c0_g1_i1.p1  ORF type:complete len:1219 (+),score=289.46 TRINITY_DN2682_c0_g1_i1:124-3657(+)
MVAPGVPPHDVSGVTVPVVSIDEDEFARALGSAHTQSESPHGNSTPPRSRSAAREGERIGSHPRRSPAYPPLPSERKGSKRRVDVGRNADLDRLLVDVDGQVDSALRRIADVAIATELSDTPAATLQAVIDAIRTAKKEHVQKCVEFDALHVEHRRVKGQLEKQLDDKDVLEHENGALAQKLRALETDRAREREDLERDCAQLQRRLRDIESNALDAQEEKELVAKKLRAVSEDKDRQIADLVDERKEKSELSKKLRAVQDDHERGMGEREREFQREIKKVRDECDERLREWVEEDRRKFGQIAATFPEKLQADKTGSEASPVPRVQKTVRFGSDFEQLEVARDEIHEAYEDAVLSMARSALGDCTERLSLVQKERDALMRQLAEFRGAAEARLAEESRQAQELAAEVERKDEIAENRGKRVKRLEAELEELAAEVERKDEIAENRGKRVKRLEAELEELNSDRVPALERRVKKLEQEAEALRDDNEEQQRDIAAKKSLLDERAGNVDALEGEAQGLRAALRDLKHTKETAEATQSERMKGLHSQLVSAQQEVDELEGEVQRLKDRQQLLHNRNSELVDSDSSKDRRLKKCLTDVEQLEMDLAGKDADLRGQKAKLDEVEERLAEAEKAAAESARKLRRCEEGQGDVDAELEKKGRVIKSLEAELAEANVKEKDSLKRVRFLEDEKQEQLNRVEQLAQELASQEALVGEKVKQLREKAEQLESASKRIETCESQLADKTKAVQAKDSRVEQLKIDLDRARAQLNGREGDQRMQKEAEAREKKIAGLNEDVNRLSRELKAREGDPKLERLQRLCDRQKKELDLLRQQLRQVYASANLERGLLSIQLQQDHNRAVVENQQQHCAKVLQRHWRRIQMPFGKEGSLGIKIRGPGKGDIESPVIVADLHKDTASYKAGLRPDALIVRVDNAVGTWPVVTRSDFLKAIGPQGHVFEGVEITIRYVTDKKWVDEWRKKLAEHFRSNKRVGSVLQKIGDDKNQLVSGSSFVKRKKLMCSPPSHLVREIKVKVDPMSEDAKRNRLKHTREMGEKLFGSQFHPENVFAMQSHPEMWRSLVLSACEQCGTTARQMIPTKEAVSVVDRLAIFLGCEAPTAEASHEALTLMADDASGISFTELTLVCREIFMDIVFRDALGGAAQGPAAAAHTSQPASPSSPRSLVFPSQ